MVNKKKFYAVANGRATGVFSKWFGEAGAFEQVDKFPGARYKGFPTYEEALAFIEEYRKGGGKKTHPNKTAPAKRSSRRADDTIPCAPTLKEGKPVYTDGACFGNPGPGGYGVVIPAEDGDDVLLSEGYRLTTNNRMELLACIVALEHLSPSTRIALHSDSRYVINGIEKGWARKWKKNGWMRTPAEPAKNADLWEKLLDLCERHTVHFYWVKGHSGDKYNELCDVLAKEAAEKSTLLKDDGFEA